MGTFTAVWGLAHSPVQTWQDADRRLTLEPRVASKTLALVQRRAPTAILTLELALRCTLGRVVPLPSLQTGESGGVADRRQAGATHVHHVVPVQVGPAKYLHVLRVVHWWGTATDPFAGS